MCPPEKEESLKTSTWILREHCVTLAQRIVVTSRKGCRVLNVEAVEPLMEDKQSPVLIQVYMADDDGAVREELLARQIGEDTYELLSSPGLAQNLARGDIVSIKDKNAPAEVLKRGGNFCIQIYADCISPEDVTALENDVIRELDGTLDGLCEGVLALAIPAKNGMEKINVFFDKFREKTGIEYYYANVYKNLDDDSDETLLYWWLDS